VKSNPNNYVAPWMHEATAKLPKAWLSNALHLWRVSELVWQRICEAREEARKAQVGNHVSDDVGLFHTHMFLAGLALENAVKGLLVQQGSLTITRGRLKWGCSGHDIERLMDKASIPLSLAERDLVRRLSACVTWAGRYPVPMKGVDMEVVIGGDEPDIMKAILDRCLGRYEISGRHGWRREDLRKP